MVMHVSKGDPRPRRADFASHDEFMASFALWCRIHAWKDREFFHRRPDTAMSMTELRKRLHIDD